AAGVQTVLVAEAPPNADLAGAQRWEAFRNENAAPVLVSRERKDLACIVYSSGTGGGPQGCVMTHEKYLEPCGGPPLLFPVLAGAGCPHIFSTTHPTDLIVGFFGPFPSGAA